MHFCTTRTKGSGSTEETVYLRSPLNYLDPHFLHAALLGHVKKSFSLLYGHTSYIWCDVAVPRASAEFLPNRGRRKTNENRAAVSKEAFWVIVLISSLIDFYFYFFIRAKEYGGDWGRSERRVTATGEDSGENAPG